MKRTCLPFQPFHDLSQPSQALWYLVLKYRKGVGSRHSEEQSPQHWRFLEIFRMLRSSNCTKEFTSSVEVFLKSAKNGPRCLICFLFYVVLPRPGWSNFTCAYYVSNGLNHLSVSWLGTWFGIPGRPPGVWRQFEFGMTIFQVQPHQAQNKNQSGESLPSFSGASFYPSLECIKLASYLAI